MSKQTNIDQWQVLATKQLRGKPLDSLNWETPEGIDVKPLYTAEDLEKIEPLLETITRKPAALNEGNFLGLFRKNLES